MRGLASCAVFLCSACANRVGEVGKIPRPVEFKGQVANGIMDPGEQLAWHRWECVTESQSAYIRRCAGSAGSAKLVAQ